MFLPYLSLTLFPVTCFQLYNIPSCIMNLRKMKLKKGNTQMEFKYLVFARANANAWQMLWPENVLKREFDVAVLMVRGISLEKGFWMVKIWQTPVGKRFKRSTLNFTYTFLTGCFTKTHPFFLTMSHSFFIAIIRRDMKAHFGSKIFEKKIARTGLFVAWLATHQCK